MNDALLNQKRRRVFEKNEKQQYPKNHLKIVQYCKNQHQVSVTSPLSNALSCASRTFKLLSSPVSLSKFPSNSDPANLNKKPDNADSFPWEFSFTSIHISLPDYHSKFHSTKHEHWYITYYPEDYCREFTSTRRRILNLVKYLRKTF